MTINQWCENNPSCEEPTTSELMKASLQAREPRIDTKEAWNFISCSQNLMLNSNFSDYLSIFPNLTDNVVCV